jgi:ParB family chromosome partitioning protein
MEFYGATMSSVELKGFRGLQGLDVLLTESKAEEFSKENIFNIPVDRLVSGKYQPRTDIDDSSLNDLMLSIRSQGIILPLIVRRLDPEKYEIIAGERRWRAAKIAGLKTVPAIIRDIPDETALAFALIENIQRESLSPMDEAQALARLKDEFSMTHEEIAERVGRSRSAVTNLLRLLLLPDEVTALLRAGKIEMGHARALLSLDSGQQYETAKKIVEKGLSVREAEKIVQKIKHPANPKTRINKFEDKIFVWEKILSDKFSSDVKISLNNHGEGRVVIHIHSPEEIEWLIENTK